MEEFSRYNDPPLLTPPAASEHRAIMTNTLKADEPMIALTPVLSCVTKAPAEIIVSETVSI